MYTPEEIRKIWISCRSLDDWDRVFAAFDCIMSDKEASQSFGAEHFSAFERYGNIMIDKLTNEKHY